MRSCIFVFALLAAMAKTSPVAAFTLVGEDSEMRGWQNKELRFRLNPTGCPADLASWIDGAIQVWNAVPTSGLRVSRGDDTGAALADLNEVEDSNDPVIFCVSDMSQFGVDPHNIPGFATGHIFNEDKHIVSAFLVLNVDPNGRANIARMPRKIAEVVIAHEIGHVLGLGHSKDTQALMYYDATKKKTLSLAQDDSDGLTYLYPRDELSEDALLGGCGSIGAGRAVQTKLLIWLAIAVPLVLALRVGPKGRSLG